MRDEDEPNKVKKEPTGDYPEGYCRPPERSRWKKGTSGNPDGRKKDRSKQLIADMIRAALNKKITISSDGKEERITILEAAVRRQVNDLLSATATQRHRAFNHLLQLGFLDPSSADMMPSAETRAAFLEELARMVDEDERGPTT